MPFSIEFLAQTRSHHALLDHRQLRRQRPGSQQNGKVVGGFHGEAARDLTASTQDRFANDGSRNDFVIQHDRERPPHVLLGDLRELAGAGGIELERHDRFAGPLVEAGLRIGELITRYDHPLLQEIGLPIFGLRPVDNVRFRRRPPLQSLLDRNRGVDEAERELGRLAEDIEQLLRIPETGHLHQDAIITLALDRWFDEAKLVDALADDLDRLIDHLPDALEQRGLRDREAHEAAPDVLDVERALAGAA